MTFKLRFYQARGAVIFSLLLGGGITSAAGEPESYEFFEKKIRPVLIESCYKCHSAEAQKAGKLKGELLLDTRAGIRAGGESGPAVVPGNPEESLLLSAIRHDEFEMPPKNKLDRKVIADFEQWIGDGAPDPREGEAVVADHEEGIDMEAAREFWAFKPPLKHPAPEVSNAKWPLDDIDRFLAAEQKEQGVQPVGDALPNILIRRLYYDLIGLPPTPDQVAEFESAVSKDRRKAIEELVDSLLASRHFGERWGRHWLDVARYSESNGAPDKNGTWPVAYRYRDYVIESFNQDKPFDQFVKEQVAGDLIAAADEEKDADLIVATGLLALGMKTANERMDEIDEQMDTVGKAVLGLAIGCARCHDHKFDPIPTRDYYSLAGIFINSVPKDGNSTFSRARTIGDVDKNRTNEAKDFVQKLGSKEAEIRKLNREIREFVEQGTGRFDVASTLEDNVARIEGGHKSKAEDRLKKLRAAEKELPGLRKGSEVVELFAVAVHETGVKGKMANTKIHIRGSDGNLGDEVPRGLLTVFPETNEFPIPEDASGRKQLAEWLGSEKNPLTARVIVNRVWHNLFGLGIVRTTDNFGETGERPTHPELLDRLAVDFMEDGWSIKRLVRRLVLTRAYQLADTFDSDNFEADPANVTLWHGAPSV